MQGIEQSKRQSLGEWWCSSIIALFVIGALAVHAPTRVKLIVLFTVAVCLFAAWATASLAKTWSLSPVRSHLYFVAGSLILLQLGIGFATWRKQVSQLDAQKQIHPLLARMAIQRRQFMEAAENETPEQKSQREEVLRSFARDEQILIEQLDQDRRFDVFLQRRLLAFGELPPTMATCIWVGEIACGVIAGTWLFHRMSRGGIDKLANDNISVESSCPDDQVRQDKSSNTMI